MYCEGRTKCLGIVATDLRDNVLCVVVMGQVKVSLISPTQDELTLLYYRLNRFVTASIVGAVLSCTALTLQTVTRNYLVDSGLLGVNSGAVLGKVLSMFLKVGPSQLFALAGSMIALIATFTLEVWVGVIF